MNCWQYSPRYSHHPQPLTLFSSLLEQFYLVQVNSHLTAPSLHEGSPQMNFPYHPRSGSSHIYLTNPLSSGILQFQSEIVADPKNTNFHSERNTTEIYYCEYNFHIHVILLFPPPFGMFNNARCQQNRFVWKCYVIIIHDWMTQTQFAANDSHLNILLNSNHPITFAHSSPLISYWLPNCIFLHI